MGAFYGKDVLKQFLSRKSSPRSFQPKYLQNSNQSLLKTKVLGCYMFTDPPHLLAIRGPFASREKPRGAMVKKSWDHVGCQWSTIETVYDTVTLFGYWSYGYRNRSLDPSSLDHHPEINPPSTSIPHPSIPHNRSTHPSKHRNAGTAITEAKLTWNVTCQFS